MALSRLTNFLKSVNDRISLALGEFSISKTLGQGGNGIVYEASINGQTVAIKFLVTEATGNTKDRKIKRFLSEYFNIITIDDTSSIVRYIDYDLLKFEDESGILEVPVIIMKKYDSSLAKIQNNANEEKFIALFKFLIDVVKKIHQAGIIHRDIKPENILLDSNRFVLADFGIANYNPEMFKILAETEKKERLGNRLFSAPEQEIDSIEAHPTMDIYAIGQVLQWYVTGYTHRGTGRQRITSIFPELKVYDNIIEKCLEQNPKNRFQNTDEIENFIKRSREKNVFDYLYLFDRICVSCFPRNDNGIIHCNDKNKIDRLLLKFKDHENDFDDTLWWVDGDGSFEFTLTQKGNGIWKFDDSEYDITDVWIHYDSSVFNDFILFRFKEGIPFEFESQERYYSAIVDDKHHISYSEYSNGYAEIDGEIIELSEHQVEFIDRQNKEGYFFIGTRASCIIHYQNEEQIRYFIEGLLSENRQPSIEELKEFQKIVRKNKDDEVKMNL